MNTKIGIIFPCYTKQRCRGHRYRRRESPAGFVIRVNDSYQTLGRSRPFRDHALGIRRHLLIRHLIHNQEQTVEVARRCVLDDQMGYTGVQRYEVRPVSGTGDSKDTMSDRYCRALDGLGVHMNCQASSHLANVARGVGKFARMLAFNLTLGPDLYARQA